MQGSRSTRVVNALSRAQLQDGYVSYGWEKKMRKSLPIQCSSCFLSLLILPTSTDPTHAQYHTLDDTLAMANAWLNSAQASGVPIVFMNVQTEALLTKISGETTSSTVSADSVNDLASLANASLYCFEDYHGVDIGVMKAVRLWYTPVAGEYAIEIKLIEGDTKLGFAVSRTEEGFIFISSVIDDDDPSLPSTRSGLRDLYREATRARKLIIISRVANEKVLPWLVSSAGAIRCYDTVSLSQKLSLHRHAIQSILIHVLMWDREIQPPPPPQARDGGGGRRPPRTVPRVPVMTPPLDQLMQNISLKDGARIVKDNSESVRHMRIGKQFDQYIEFTDDEEIPNRKDKPSEDDEISESVRHMRIGKQFDQYVEFTDEEEIPNRKDKPSEDDEISGIFQVFGNLLSKRGIQEFTFDEIDLATKKFTDRIQGFTNVYLGVLLPDDRQIAVKRFLPSSEVALWELGSEILAFIGSRHPNIANILGFCREGHVELMLIYEFMQDRTLSHFLRQEEKRLELNMTRRFEVCLGVAKGLAYLLDEDFIHGDIKPSNILLDEDFNPKIMNLSPSKRMRKDMTYVTTKGVGAFGYLDPAYLHSGKFTEEGDVYSYGVVVLELVSGKRFFEVNVCQLHECLNKEGNLLRFVDPRLIDSDDSREKAKALILLELSVLCTKPKPADRPSITKVVSKLEGDIYDMEPSKEQVIQENPTTEICSHEAFENLRALVLSNSLEEALREKIKMEIFHLCEILDGSTFLPEARSGLAHRVKDFLTFTSQLSIVCKEDSSYDEDSELAPLDEKMKLLNLQNPVASDSNSIIELAKSLMKSRKVAAKRRLIHSKKCIDMGKEDWKFIQTRFK